MVKLNYVVVIQLVNKLLKFLGDLLSHWNLTNEIFDEIVRCSVQINCCNVVVE